MKKIAIVLFLGLNSLLSFAQEWVQRYQNSVSAYENMELRKAKDEAGAALEIYKTTTDPDKNLAAILRQLSLVSYELGETDDAVKYAQEEVVTLQNLGLDLDLNFAYCLQNLAVIRMARSEYGAAEPLLAESRRIGSDYLSDESYELAVITGNLAITLFNLKKDEEATEAFQQSITALQGMEEVGLEYYAIIYGYASLLVEQGNHATALPFFEELADFYSYDKPNFDYGSVLIKVADAHDQLGRFQESATKYEESVSNFEAIAETASAEYGIALNGLSIELQKTGDFDRAFEVMEKLLEQQALTKTENPEPYATSLANYANLLIRNGERARALEQLNEVFALYETQSLTKDLTFVNALESKAGLDLVEGNLDAAGEAITEAISLAEANAYGNKTYSLYNQRAKILARQSKLEEAKLWAERAIAICEESFGERAIQTAYVKNTLADIETQMGNYPGAEVRYKQILEIFKSSFGEQHPETAIIIANYSSLLQLMGNYYTAEYYLQQALEIKLNVYGAENADYLTTYENLALLYQTTARYTAAERILSEIVTLKERQGPQNPELAYTYTNLGAVKKQLAEYTEAEVYFKKALEIYKNTLGTGHIFYAACLNSTALLYQKMGNLEAAKPLFEQALAIYERTIGKMNPDYATVLENLATLYEMEDNDTKAKELLEEALVIDEQVLGTDHPLYSKTLHNLASIYEQNAEYDRAKELFDKALAIEERVYGTSHPSYASTLYNLAVLEQELENYEQAKKYYQQVVDIRRTALGENHPDYTFSLFGYASVLHKTDNLEAAVVPYQEVTSRYLSYIDKYFPALSESEKSAFYGKIKPVFDSYMDFAIEFVLLSKGTPEDRELMLGSLYNLQLATKALLLNASNKVRNRISASGDPELIAMFAEWVALKENLVKGYSMSMEELKTAKINLAEMEAKANEVEKNLSLKSASFAAEFERKAVQWEDVKGVLAPGEAAVEVIRIKKKMKQDSVVYAALIVTPELSSPQLSLNPRGLVMEKQGFKTYKNAIMYKVKDAKSFSLFWADIHEKLGSITTLYLSADGVLNKVNIATLFNPSTNQYVVENYRIRLLSNTRELVDGTPAIAKQNNAEIFGFPKYNLTAVAQNDGGGIFADEGTRASAFGSTIAELPGTLVEVNDISAILSGSDWQISKYLETAATEEQIKKLESPKILHIATHGFFLEDIQLDADQGGLTSRNAKFNPLLRSGLLFAGAENTMKNEKIAGKEDGILTAYEAMNLNLDNTELVVMSACETGLGEVKNGEGVYGLQRSLLVAGADNLIMSLWKVNDETTQLLMSSFYKNWFDGKPKLEAFNLAIDEVRSKFKDPYYWGAFVILGK